MIGAVGWVLDRDVRARILGCPGFTVPQAHGDGRPSSALHAQSEDLGSAEVAVGALPRHRYQEPSAHHCLHLLDRNTEEIGCTGDAEYVLVDIHLAGRVISGPRTRLDAAAPGFPGRRFRQGQAAWSGADTARQGKMSAEVARSPGQQTSRRSERDATQLSIMSPGPPRRHVQHSDRSIPEGVDDADPARRRLLDSAPVREP